MAFDEGLAERIREVFQNRHDVAEKKMFGGLAFMISGHMCCGIIGEKLMLRVGAGQYDELLQKTCQRDGFYWQADERHALHRA